MSDEIIKKYVYDSDELLAEVSEMDEVNAYNWQGKKEEMVIFLFGRLFRFFKFDSALVGHDPNEHELDGTAWTQENGEVNTTKIEFEVYSTNFKKDHPKSRNCLIVCWEDHWKDLKEKTERNLDIFELKLLWKKAHEKVTKKRL